MSLKSSKHKGPFKMPDKYPAKLRPHFSQPIVTYGEVQIASLSQVQSGSAKQLLVEIKGRSLTERVSEFFSLRFWGLGAGRKASNDLRNPNVINAGIEDGIELEAFQGVTIDHVRQAA
jgi:hypothetical protein